MKRLIEKFIIGIFITTIFLMFGFLVNGCSVASGKQSPVQKPDKISVTNNGKTITFSENNSGLQEFKSSPVEKGSATLSVLAPARIVASITPSENNSDKIILFDSPDVTSLYSQYRQSKANVELTSKNLARIKQMYQNLGVTAKDLNQAETDASTAKTTFEEMEGRLKVLGFNPSELESINGRTVWLMADVPEAQLHEITRGENVKITFAAFPDKVFFGRTEEIGEIIDPTTREVKVRISLSNHENKFLPGMFAQVDFGNKINEAFILPLTAVVTVEGKNYVFIQTSTNSFERKQVTLANSDASKLVVLDGINAGDKVIISGAMLLKGLSFGY